jgi:hypothetical protein
MILYVCAFFSLQVKSLYVKNLPKTVTEEQLRTLFEHLGEITKVILPPAKAGHENRYGFVHFKERHMAIKALKNTERYELDGELSSLTSFCSWLILLHVLKVMDCFSIRSATGLFTCKSRQEG